MKLVRFEGADKYKEMFLALPKTLYSDDELTQSETDEKAILNGTSYINTYAKFTPFLVVNDEETEALARCMVTEYSGDPSCYFGFFECVEDKSAFDMLMDGVEKFALEQQYTGVEGPLDACLWMRYRFKTNNFDRPPYLGEPYNKSYYPKFFEERGYAVKETYVSNDYKALPKDDFAIAKYKKRYDEFVAAGYEIRSPRKSEWDKCIVEIYEMIKALYNDFLTYHEISREDFVKVYGAYKSKLDLSMVKMAYYKGKAVGFFMGSPDYGNMASRSSSLGLAVEFFKTRRKPQRYVLLYMGVMPEHRGVGKALTHAIMEELASKGTPSIGSLIRTDKANYDYAKEYMVGRYEYAYYEHKFTIADYLRRGDELWGDGEYIVEGTADEGVLPYLNDFGRTHSFREFTADVRRCARWLLEKGYKGKNIALYGANSYSWMVCDMAVMGFVGKCFPLDAQYGTYELLNVLKAGKVDLFIYDKARQQDVVALRGEVDGMEFISFETLERSYSVKSANDDIQPVGPYSTAKVIFTSGTSATPKGVMLSQSNMLSNWRNLFERTPMTREDLIYLVLPLNHVYAGVAAYLYTIISGMRIYLGSPRAELCVKDMEAVKPTVFIGVPLLAQRFYELAGGESALHTGEKAAARAGGESTQHAGDKATSHTEGESALQSGGAFTLQSNGENSLQIEDASPRQTEATRAKALNAMLGGALKYFYCGGTRIEQGLKDAFVEAGVPFIEAYGLSETSSVVALDIVGEYRKASTGKVLECLRTKIADPDEDGYGELLVRGGSRMSGYYNMTDVENRQYIDEGGYFHTGDMARIDEDGYLYIMGRTRKLLVTSNGKNVYPQEVEDMICLNPSVTRATLYLQNDRLRLKVWYKGERCQVEDFVRETQGRLPKYMAFEEFECIEDREGARFK